MFFKLKELFFDKKWERLLGRREFQAVFAGFLLRISTHASLPKVYVQTSIAKTNPEQTQNAFLISV